MRHLAAALLLALGVAALVFGEADDSPGLQGIGLLLGITAVVLITRARLKRPDDPADPVSEEAR